jgi:hypothetical protein
MTDVNDFDEAVPDHAVENLVAVSCQDFDPDVRIGCNRRCHWMRANLVDGARQGMQDVARAGRAACIDEFKDFVDIRQRQRPRDSGPSSNAVPLPERRGILIGHEKPSPRLGDRRPLFLAQRLDSRAARFDLARQLGQFLLVLLRPVGNLPKDVLGGCVHTNF